MRAVALGVALLLASLPRPALAAGSPGVGASAPAFELKDVGGATRTVAWGDGGPAATIVYFFDPLTPDCLLETSMLDALHTRARDYGLAVYAVEARGRQPAEVTRTMERYCRIYREPGFPVLPDPAFRTGRTFGVGTVPVTFVMESHGVILDRIEGYGHAEAIAIARRVEQLLRRERGAYSEALREAGISEAEEREATARLAGARPAAPAPRSLGAGDRVPELEFTDVGGRAGRWSWGQEAGKGLRIAAFFGGLTVTSIEQLNWLDGVARRGRDAGLDVVAVEAGGMDLPALQAALEKYRRMNPDPAFPIVADPQGRLAGVFGPFEQLPQTYLIGSDGTVIYRADGFSAGEGEIIVGKIERAFAVAGRPFPQQRSVGGAAPAPAPAPVEEEAPSIRRRREADERYRSSIVQADAAFMAWEFDKALDQYLAALAAQPDDLHALVRTAQLYERRGDPDRALETWRRVLRVRPDHAEAAGRVRDLAPTR
jgi:peroxiredoxin